jgi:hypothetical protein
MIYELIGHAAVIFMIVFLALIAVLLTATAFAVCGIDQLVLEPTKVAKLSGKLLVILTLLVFGFGLTLVVVDAAGVARAYAKAHEAK